MTARHTVELGDQRVADVRHRPGAMYMRAEARRAGESAAVVTATPGSRRRTTPRTQLAALTMVWLLIAGITVLVGLRWAREGGSRPAPHATVAQAPVTPAPVAQARARQAAAAVVAPPAIFRPGDAAAARPLPPKAAQPAVAAAVSRPVRIVKPAAAALVITSTPAGALVTVDGVGWGATPARIRYLPPGTKRVRVTRDGYVSQERSVRVDGSAPMSLSVVLRPRVVAAAAGAR